jgi:hypothetical protein
MSCGVFGVTTVYSFCSDGLSNDGAKNVKFFTEKDHIPILAVLTKKFPKSTFTDSGCNENFEDLSEKKFVEKV